MCYIDFDADGVLWLNYIIEKSFEQLESRLYMLSSDWPLKLMVGEYCFV